MRVLTDHIVGGLNENLEITARDLPGPGGASHLYHIAFPTGGLTAAAVIIGFQNGPLKESNINGVSNEAVLAVLIDRLRGFQSGEFACRENAIALTHMEDAMHWLQHRTRQRIARGVEGTLKK